MYIILILILRRSVYHLTLHSFPTRRSSDLGGPAPALEREQLGEQARVVRRDRRHVDGAQACREQRLMRVAHRGVGEEHAPLGEHPGGQALGPELIESLLRARRRGGQRTRRQLRGGEARGARAAGGLGVAVDDDAAEVGEEARGAVALARPAQQLRRLVDEARAVIAPRKARVSDELVEEAEIR